MPCTTGIGNDRPPSKNEYQDTLEFFLCRACRHLSRKQLLDIVRENQSRFCSTTNWLYEWYKKHLEEDLIHSHRPDENTTQNEIERIKGVNIKPTVYPY